MTEKEFFDKVFTVIYESSILGRTVHDTTQEVVDITKEASQCPYREDSWAHPEWNTDD